MDYRLLHVPLDLIFCRLWLFLVISLLPKRLSISHCPATSIRYGYSQLLADWREEFVRETLFWMVCAFASHPIIPKLISILMSMLILFHLELAQKPRLLLVHLHFSICLSHGTFFGHSRCISIGIDPIPLLSVELFQ